ncbi:MULTISPECIES: sensor histidine kinase [Nitrincola]|uniref:histidine kinase n=1 Tax=Nitrincola nitratireducens TaxID=1229521 RepID=W9V4M2_9GAMM|nr:MULTISPECIES: PAS domain-containing sensor histidine kinase [Nitrincola]EXJ11077.1 Sensor protein fixL [Nitrincola nitratireducens]
MTPNQDTYNELLKEADRYRLLAEQSTDLISRHSATPDWVFIDVNPAIEPLLGFTADEIIGTSGYALFHPEDADNLKNRADSVRYRDGLYTNVYRYRHKDGHYVWFETTSRTIKDDDNQPVEVICVSRDVTERELALQATRRLARVVEASSDIILFCSQQGLELTYVNESAQRTLSINADTGHLPALSLFFEPNYFKSQVITALESAANTGNWNGTLILDLPKDSQCMAELREIIAHRDRNNRTQVEYYTLIGRDVTLERKAEEQAKRQQTEMAHLSRLLSVGEMATELAHEVNQPLATILNYSNGTLRQIEEQQITQLEHAKHALKLISRQAHRAAEIIKRIRRFVQRTDYQRTLFSINDCCHEVAEFLKQEATDQKIEFIFELDASAPKVEGDRVQIEQVIMNLVRNAIEAYSHKNIALRYVILCTFTEKNFIIVKVSDNAGGIDPGLQSTLFDPFTTSKTSGLGMGLSIARSLIESHGGQLWLEPNGVAGSHFLFKLPTRARHEPKQ